MKRLIVIVLFLLLRFTAGAQTNGTQFNLPTTLPNAPEAASLGRYGDIPVSIATGVPDISVPLYTVKSGSLSLPISISYHASGIKVADYPSSVGLGWALNAGGAITRVVQGIEDENNIAGAPQGDPAVQGNQGFYYQIFPDSRDPSLAAKEKCIGGNITNTYYDYHAYPTDGQPDLFFYNMSSQSGKFILKNRIANGIEPGFMTIPYSPIKVSMPNRFQQFNITDVDGTNYYYGSPNFQDSVIDYSQAVNNGGFPFGPVATAWHVQRMVSPDNSDTILFKYDLGSFRTQNSASQTLDQNFDIFEFSQEWSFSYSPLTSSNTSIYGRLLTEIDFSTGKITFDYDQTTPEGPTLTTIHIYNLKGPTYSETKQYVFYHSESGTRLDSLKEAGVYLGQNVSNPPYVFSYSSYDGYDAPPSNKVFAQDFWGYFNGKINNQNLLFVAPPTTEGTTTLGPLSAAANREPDSNYLRVGTIQSVKYPTGGQTIFDFEPNQTTRTYEKDSVTYSTELNGVHIRESVVGYTPSVQFTIADPLVTQYQSNGDTYNALLDFTGALICSSGCLLNLSSVEVDDLTGGAGGGSITLTALNAPNPPSTSEVKYYMTLQTGHTYVLKFTTPIAPVTGQSYKYLLDAYVSGQGIANTTPEQVTEPVMTGGLRIRKITSIDALGKSLVKEYRYTKSYFNSNLFTGDFDAIALDYFQFDGEDWPEGGPDAQGNQCRLWGLAKRHFSGNTPLPLGSVSNNSASYNEIEEYQSDGNGNYNGKTVYTYNRADDIVNISMPFFKVDREDLRNLLIDKKIYSYENGNYRLIENDSTVYVDLDSLQKRKQDTVIFYAAHGLRDNLITKKLVTSGQGGSPDQVSYEPAAYPIEGGTLPYAASSLGCPIFDQESSFQVTKFYYTSPRLVKKFTLNTLFDNLGNSVGQSVNYDYANLQHIFPTHIQKVNSKGETVEDSIKYVLDYPSSNCANTADSVFAANLETLKQSYFPVYGNDFVRFSGGAGPNMQNPSCLNQIQADTVYAAVTDYEQATNAYNAAREQLVVSYNQGLASQSACLANYYSSASDDQKAIIDLQKQNNIVPQLEVKERVNGQPATIKQTFYKTFLTGVTMPFRVMFTTLNNPIENRLQYLAYDQHSKLLSASKTGDMPVSYIWDYNDEYPIAQAKNANVNDIAYTSFEADGSGGWTIGTGSVDQSKSIAGKASYLLNGSISKTGLNSATTYIISYWTQNSSPFSIAGTISGYPVKGKAVTINNSAWTLYVHKVTGQGTISVSGSGQIDELRLYPATAQMITYTYDPLIGMTSQTDAGNRVAYYEYDGLGRLKRIRDQDYNILKAYDYQYLAPAGSNQSN